MPNSIARNVIKRVKVRESKRAKSHERRFPQSSYSKKITKLR
ncbi:MAG: hypothetical protein AABX99_04260 [Nanoarchaeota archaeon]